MQLLVPLLNNSAKVQNRFLSDAFKKIAQKETSVNSDLSPSPPTLNGTRGIGTQKITFPPSGNRDKLHFSRGELINTL